VLLKPTAEKRKKAIKGDDFYKVKRADLSINPLTY
jgi:hypothetical protein